MYQCADCCKRAKNVLANGTCHWCGSENVKRVTTRNDNNSHAPYRHDDDVEAVVNKSMFDYYYARVDKALAEGLHRTDPVNFQKIVDNYLEAKKSLDKS